MFAEFGYWQLIQDGDPRGRALYRRHYSAYHYKDGRERWTKLFVGPGKKKVLLGVDSNALFVWRKFRDDSGQEGVNCSIFRNESDRRSSDLILEAETWAQNEWSGERMYTYVNPRCIGSRNPGYCFLMAGWRRCGYTKVNRLLILEKLA